MATTIYYFSATGNSLYAAKSIAAKLGDCTVASMPALRRDAEVVAQADKAGFVFPLHCFGLPPLVSKFVEKLNLESAHYIFAVITCGNPFISGALRQLSSLLAAKGKQLDAGFRIKMVSNYTPLSNIPAPEKREKLLRQADEKIAVVAEIIKAGKQLVEKEYLAPPVAFFNNKWQRRTAKADTGFTVSPGCIACGRCEKICPADNIRLSDGIPVWRHNCLHCLACLHACPARCVNYGSITRKRDRYLHPGIALEELLAEMKPKD